MQSKGFFSKPIALVLIGLILGTSLGLGGGYAVFYPQMVKQQSRSIEERIHDVEMDIESVSEGLEKLNQTFLDMQDDFQTVRSLTEAINSLNSRIIAVENSITSLDVELDDVEDDVSELNSRLEDFDEEWTGILNEFEDLEDKVDSFNSKINSLENRIDSRESVEMLKEVLSNPEEDLLEKMTNKMYAMLSTNEDFSGWASSIGTTAAKSLLNQEIYKLTGTFVWNSLASNKVGEREYQVIVVNYFPFTFSPVPVSIPRMKMQIRSNVNVASDRVYNVQVETADIVVK
jgi:predicted  nucleic acid-binding Zn-ribbon protein